MKSYLISLSILITSQLMSPNDASAKLFSKKLMRKIRNQVKSYDCVKRYTLEYKGDTYIYCIKAGYDRLNPLLKNNSFNKICYPSGGFDGKGNKRSINYMLESRKITFEEAEICLTPFLGTVIKEEINTYKKFKY